MSATDSQALVQQLTSLRPPFMVTTYAEHVLEQAADNGGGANNAAGPYGTLHNWLCPQPQEEAIEEPPAKRIKAAK